MLSDFTGADRVYIACGYTDLRRGIDGLASMVQQQFHLDPFTNTLFLFCGRRRDRIKALYWERICAALQTAGIRQLPMASVGKGSQSPDHAAVPLAHGGAEHRPAKGAQAGKRSGNYLRNFIFYCTFQEKYGIMST